MLDKWWPLVIVVAVRELRETLHREKTEQAESRGNRGQQGAHPGQSKEDLEHARNNISWAGQPTREDPSRVKQESRMPRRLFSRGVAGQTCRQPVRAA